MSYGCFTNKNNLPEEKEIADVLSAAFPLWQEFNQTIFEKYSKRREWKFYGRNFGWALRYKKDGRAFTSLFPDKNCFTILIILTSNQVEKTRSLELGEAIRLKIENTPQLYEGRWIFISIATGDDINYAEKLLKIKSEKF